MSAPADQTVKVTELVLRDGHQSMIATRMRTEDMLPIIPQMDDVGFFSVEMWGGATFDVCMRYLNEDPWERLRLLRRGFKKTSLQMLLRGQNLVGYRHYSDDIVVKFVGAAAKNGIDVFRIFDALNDVRNMQVAIKAAKDWGRTVEGAISYTTSPVHTIENHVSFAQQLAALGCDIICIKDMAGLLTPGAAADLTRALLKEVGLPVHVHSHTTAGLAHMSLLAAVQAGATYIDTVISPFSQGSSHPPTESVVAALRGTPYDTGLPLEQLVPIAAHFEQVKSKYEAMIDPIAERVDISVLLHQIPGGMLSNLVSQLKEQNALDKYAEVIDEVPRVRQDLGYPPLVTPTSQIVGTQAVMNVVLGSRYKVISKEVRDYVRGLYGRPPGPVNDEVKRLAIGDEPVITTRPADSLTPSFDAAENECHEYCRSEEDVLSYALFPQVALDFFRAREGQRPLGAAMVPTSSSKRMTFSRSSGNELGVTVDGRRYKVRAERNGSSVTISIDGQVYDLDIDSIPPLSGKGLGGAKETGREGRSGRLSTKRAETGRGAVAAPMPGRVVAVKAKEGDQVEKGDLLIVLEAMKMENEIQSPVSGVVARVLVKEGDSVGSADTMIIVE